MNCTITGPVMLASMSGGSGSNDVSDPGAEMGSRNRLPPGLKVSFLTETCTTPAGGTCEEAVSNRT